MLAQEKVTEAVRLTFEEMAFLDVAAGLAAAMIEDVDEGPVLFLSYSLPQAGSFALFLPKEIKFQVAEAIYGESWQHLSAIQLDDSLLELMNVLAGRLLTQRFGATSTYAMGLPTILYGSPSDPPGQKRTEYPFHIDDLSFLLAWWELVL